MERTMLARGREDRPPAAGGPRFGQRDLGDPPIELARILTGPDDMEREVLEHSHPDAQPVRCVAVGAPEEVVVDRLGRPREAIAIEGTIDDGRDPPTRDGVLSKLEQAGPHPGQTPLSCAPSA